MSPNPVILDNANVLTVDGSRPRAQSIAVAHGRILGVGSVGEFNDTPSARIINLEGRTVVPGFNDAHNHMGLFGARLRDVPLGEGHVRTVEDIVGAIAAVVAETPSGVWVTGSGYDDNKLVERRHPTRAELDRISPNNPVLLDHTSGHFCVVNSVAMEMADIGNRAVPEGGVVALDSDGQPNGLLEEQAQSLVRDVLHPRRVADIVQNLSTASSHYVTEGITSCQEAGVGGILGAHEPLEVSAYQQAHRSGGLRVRVTLMPALESLHATAHHIDDDEPFVLDLGVHSGFGNEWLKFGAVKIFADGSLIGRTAAMFDDFEGDPGNNGYFQMDEAVLHSSILKAHRSGWQVATHAIGDRAVSSVLDAYEAAVAKYPRADTRHRIEHCGMTQARDVARIAKLGVIPVPQGRFVGELGDGMAKAVGARRGDCYRQRSFLDAGITVPGSSDRPVVAGAPLRGIHDMVNQQTDTGATFNSHEALTAEQALHCYTLASAHASFDEDDKGSVTAGKYADLTVLDQDITAVDPQAIKETTVLATMVGGNFEYDTIGLR